ncbi:unnamed protein product [Echinostoma caproni]|uniref:Endo/exonuclease/phosphatase domain-containing protein n=1 Tax=Echinostoma caproni TaxID=27848 RepID=A0A183A5J0_9TREM|nr:unnamed protein product [Echinostoma caproni]
MMADPNSQDTIVGHFNVHQDEWLKGSSDTTFMRREAEAFAVVNNLNQLVDLPTRVADRIGDRAHTLDLILKSIFTY